MRRVATDPVRLRVAAIVLILGAVLLAGSSWLPWLELRTGVESHGVVRLNWMTGGAFRLMGGYWLALGVAILMGRSPSRLIVGLGLFGTTVMLFISWAELKRGIYWEHVYGWQSATPGTHLPVAIVAVFLIGTGTFLLLRPGRQPLAT
jgi:multisubunit Na+/H+ antiporter MnhC subunit